MTAIVSIINYKGGVGKTTLTSNLAAELAYRGKNVLLLDLDPQASLTFSLITPESWAKDFEATKTIKQWFDTQDTGAPICLSSLVYRPTRVNKTIPHGSGSISLICSHLGLINVDLELATKLGGANLQQAKQNFIKVHRCLAEGLKPLLGQYDIILIDCPPNFNIVTKTAIVASDFLLVPARPDYLSTLGIDYLIRSVNSLVSDYNEFAKLAGGTTANPISPEIMGVVFTMIQEYSSGPISAQLNYMSQVSNKNDLHVFDHYIKRNDSIFADAPLDGVPVVLNRYNQGAHQTVVVGLKGVANEFMSRAGL